MGNKRSVLKRHRFAAIVVAVPIVLVCSLFIARTLRLQSIDRQIAAIEAARAIPDSENAAVLYREFFQDFAVASMSFQRMLIQRAKGHRLGKAWRSSDYPELATLISKNQEAISRLIEITKMEKCCFPIPRTIEELEGPTSPRIDATKWTSVLRYAMGNDIGEGRIEAAIEKYASIVGLARHLCEQPISLYYIIGMGIESWPSEAISRLVVEGDISDAQLDLLRNALLPPTDGWPSLQQMTEEVDALSEARRIQQIGFTDWIKYCSFRTNVQYIHGKEQDATPPSFHPEHVSQQVLTIRRGLYILVELRRYRNRRGRWPENLEAIRALLTDEILTDPRNGGPFFYEVTSDGFRLMSLGANKLDDRGHRRECDDSSLWPTWRMMDELKKEENAK